ncbi:MAG: tetratricopeptide repeat protein [Bryobacteraceae bacterium]
MRWLMLLACGVCAAQDTALLQRGAQAMREQRFADAESIYRKLVESSPDDSRLRLNLGLALYSGGKYAAARVEIDRYLKVNPQPGPVYLVSGTTLLKLQKPCDAIGPLEKAQTWQASVEVLTELGDAYNGCKRYLDAGRTYERASRLKDDRKLGRAAARSYWEAREYEKARPLFAKVETAFGKDAEFLYEYGDTLVRLEGPTAGLAYLAQAVAAQPSLLSARAAYGKALLETGRAQDAIPHLEAVVSTDPALWLALSKAYQATGRTTDAARATSEYRRRMSDRNE